MNIWKISIKNLFHKPLYTLLSIIALAISIGLLLGIRQLDTAVKQQFDNSLGNIDLVIGAKGSPLQLVLASVMHIDNPTGNISYQEAKKISKNPLIKTAVPISYGDNYKGFRIVGSTEQFAALYEAELDKGQLAQKAMEVVLGHTVAQQLNLKVGDTFLSSHGFMDNDMDVHSDPLIVVGIYKPTQKVIDRLIVTNLESVWEAHDHDDHKDHENHEGHDDHSEHIEHIDEDKEITSLLVNFKSPMGLLTIPRQINEKTSMQAALPKYEIERLFQFTGIGVKVISWIAYIILIISCITIFISLFKMVKERAFDLALLRTYGASNFQLIKIVAYEGFLIGVLATVCGVIISQSGLFFVYRMIKEEYKQTIMQNLSYIDILQTSVWVFAMIVVAITLSILPIISMNVSKILSNEK
ncbi:ABC transporter permease [Hanstruepera flava]|uniref:ABC transporter permease n=1 Tax=Hanstruepera flava TaxID=2930218 RepID=UPI0020290C7E|nr:ABC transporter permease [Hanstruepera flava]